MVPSRYRAILLWFLLVAFSSAWLPASPHAEESVAIPYLDEDPNRAPLKPGTPAPDFSLPLARESKAASAGRMLHLASYRHQPAKRRGVTVLIFWAFWCDTWKDVTRHLKHVRSALSSAQARVGCVAVDASQQPVAKSAFRSGDIWFPVAIDGSGTVGTAYGVRRVPTIFVIDRDGIVRAAFEAYPGDQTLLRAVQAARRPRR